MANDEAAETSFLLQAIRIAYEDVFPLVQVLMGYLLWSDRPKFGFSRTYGQIPGRVMV